MQTHEDLFVIRSRIAADHARVAAENSARAVRGTTVERSSRSGGRVWLGRQLIAIGSALGGTVPSGHRGTTGRPC